MPIQAPLLSPYETIQEAAMAAAYKVAEAENKSFLASEAVKEAERVSKMADDADAMLQLFKEIYEQCKLINLSPPSTSVKSFLVVLVVLKNINRTCFTQNEKATWYTKLRFSPYVN